MPATYRKPPLPQAPVFCARPLKRYLQRQLETRLARALIAGEVTEDSTTTFKVKGGELVMG